jgi:ABC-type amino acid transport system permease subunit
MNQHPLLGQRMQRLAHRHPADSELLGQFLLAQLLAGTQLAAGDLGQHGGDDPFDRGAGLGQPDRGGFRHAAPVRRRGRRCGWFNLAALYPRLGLGIPGRDPLFSVGANEIISPFVAAILALSLHEAAYMAEIVRSGVIGVDRGQRQAALALGMRPARVMRRIVLPQAMRTIIPPTGNQTISMLKTSSLVSVIALSDLLYTAQSIYGINYQVIPLLVVASLWYLIVVSVLSVGQGFLERRYGRGSV